MTQRHVDPEREAFEAFKQLPRDTPIAMINLIRYRDRADYPADHECAGQELSGADAYRNYSRASGPVFARVGGTIAWSGKPEVMLIGPAEEMWDAAFVAHYPSAAAFLEMVTDEEYRRAVVHRQAAVETSRLIRCAPRDGEKGFG
ncbi:DUF1330 domain-containing protein [Stakelama marina]|uniref:DUF1330 domain-containing protein n=1 Tax=Stakelama marina TaxID=2826939 RepID=A0A8T4IMR1_9SPHN|nr:DUF1330 domain-containing protein [Stakelama marina]MBR0553446.1 DUF1330 domain-containing protein [Stakelama marina]